MPEGCWSWSRVSESIHVCDRTDVIEIEVDDVVTLYDLCKCLRDVKPVVDRLVGLYLSYDMARFISTHDAMTRRVRRLEKLLRVVGSITCKVREPHGDYEVGVPVSLDRLLAPAIERVRDVIAILKHFEGYEHRRRDKVHQFVYPVLANALNTLKNSWHVAFITQYGVVGIELSAWIGGKTEIYLEVASEGASITRGVSEEAVMHIIRRGKDRYERTELVKEMGIKVYRRRLRNRKGAVATRWLSSVFSNLNSNGMVW